MAANNPNKLTEVRQVRGAIYLFRCECGREIECKRSRVLSGHVKSCGCAKAGWCGEARVRAGRHNGLGLKRTFLTWRRMIRRCEDSKHPNYLKYGARGIRVCERWYHYPSFYADMGDQPPGLTLDRIRNDGHYEPGNCRWATDKEQANNRRTSRMIEFRGRTQTLQQWADELGMNHSTLRLRIKSKGVDWAMTKPPPQRGS